MRGIWEINLIQFLKFLNRPTGPHRGVAFGKSSKVICQWFRLQWELLLDCFRLEEDCLRSRLGAAAQKRLLMMKEIRSETFPLSVQLPSDSFTKRKSFFSVCFLKGLFANRVAFESRLSGNFCIELRFTMKTYWKYECNLGITREFRHANKLQEFLTAFEVTSFMNKPTNHSLCSSYHLVEKIESIMTTCNHFKAT